MVVPAPLAVGVAALAGCIIALLPAALAAHGTLPVLLLLLLLLLVPSSRAICSGRRGHVRTMADAAAGGGAVVAAGELLLLLPLGCQDEPLVCIIIIKRLGQLPRGDVGASLAQRAHKGGGLGDSAALPPLHAPRGHLGGRQRLTLIGAQEAHAHQLLVMGSSSRRRRSRDHHRRPPGKAVDAGAAAGADRQGQHKQQARRQHAQSSVRRQHGGM